LSSEERVDGASERHVALGEPVDLMGAHPKGHRGPPDVDVRVVVLRLSQRSDRGHEPKRFGKARKRPDELELISLAHKARLSERVIDFCVAERARCFHGRVISSGRTAASNSSPLR